MNVTENSRTRWAVWAGVVALLVVHVSLGLSAVRTKSVTADEILHITAGYVYWRFGDYRVHPENGILPQRVAGLPAWLRGANPPPTENNVYWRTSDATVIGYQFFYESGQDHAWMLMAGRAAVMIFGVATGVLIFAWSRRLFGTAGGFFSLGLYALCPNFLAHNSLATSDSASVFFLLAASGAFWRHLLNPTLVNTALSAVLLGLACVAKYSGGLLAPIFVVLVLWRLLADRAAAKRLLARLAVTLPGHVVVAGAIIWAFYGFRFTGFAPGVPPADHFIAPWDRVLPFIGAHATIVEFCREWRLLPEAFLYGYAWVVQSAKARAAFLAGDYSILGWPEFFPLAFLWKTPIATIAAAAAGVGLLLRRWVVARAPVGADLTRVAPLLVLAGIYWLVSILGHLNIGHRHILPTYPPLFILAGGLLAAGVLPRLARFAVPAGLFAGQAAASLAAFPHYIAFFNTLAGGPANGWRLLVDSSLDWGQDLPALAAWLRENNAGPDAAPLHLSYFGSGEPLYYGIRGTRLPFMNGFKLPPAWYEPAAGLYCVSATMLQQVYSPASGPWTPAFEREYQALRASAGLFRQYFTVPNARAELERETPAEQWRRAWRRYDELRFARLCHYLRARRPDAVIAHTIFAYRLTAAEIQTVLNGPYSEWLRAIEGARSR